MTTVAPARVLGLENAVGTIDVGKLANMVITQGDLFAADGKIRHVIVEGVRYEVPDRSGQGQRGGGRSSGTGEEVSR